jgi:antitoxin component YwqK of YwqJK toxin-antitoxin module/Tfp pilus assembly protein PilF
MNKVILTLVYLFFFSFSEAQVEYYNSEAFVAEALKYIGEENYADAREVMDKVHPSDEEYYYSCKIEAANSYLAEENTDGAIVLYKKLLDDGHFEIKPSLYVNYGSVMRDAERFEEAEKIYKEAEVKYPNYSHLIFNMAISYYRSGEVQKSIDYIKRTILINPAHSQAHYLLGVVALENGQIAEGALALLGYLADDPEDEFALNAVIQLNKKMAQNYLEETDYVFSETGDDFSKLTLILRNQFPLNEKYKLECDIDDIYPRHAQAIAEYAAEHDVKDGFFEKQYIPYLADIYQKGHIENFTYYTLNGLENFEDQLKKKGKGITRFYKEYFVDNFWYHFAVRKMPHLGKESDVMVYCENSVPTMISEYEGRMKQGWSIFVDEYGRMTGKAKIVDDQPIGLLTYYNAQGGKSEEINFENGARNGAQITYYETGEKSSEWINENNVAEGLFTTYYKDGSIYCQSTFKNDEFHDKSYCNYASGQQKLTVNYNMGKFDGERINYYQSGKLSSTESYENGKLNGLSEYYGIDGRKLSSVSFKDDIASQNYTIKDKAGNITFDYVVDGDKATSTDYVNGKISQVSRIKNNELTGIDVYSDGNKYTSQKYKGEEIKECIQYTRGEEKGSKVKLENHKLYDIDGNILSHRRYEDGKLDGQNVFYHLNGSVRSEINYIEGKEDGSSKFYDIKGNLKTEYRINEDLINGIYKEYKDGVLAHAYNYKEGKLNGVTTGYHASGKVSSEGFYQDDQPLGKFKYYNSNGVLVNEDKYEDGELVSSSYFERDGGIGCTIEYKKQSGVIIKEVDYSPVRFQMNLLNGEFHGPYFGIDKSGDSLYVTNFVNVERRAD